MDRMAFLRHSALGAIVFVATLAVLFGLTAVVDRAPTTASATPTSRSAPSAAAVGAGTTSGPDATSGADTTPTPAEASPSASGATTPSPAATSDPVLVGAGDIADCASDGDEATAALLDGIDGTVFTAGDNAYPDGTAAQFRDCYDPSWGRHRDRTWPAPGNHDWHAPDLAGYRAYFGAAAVGPDGAPWYARTLGTWRVLVLDSDCDVVGGCGPDSPQGRWLAGELAGASGAARCTVAIFHHPRFSSGAEHGDDPTTDPIWRALYAGGVDVVINGHEHSYERFAPQDPDGREDRARGIRAFVVGTGGRALRGFGDPRPNSELRASLTFGVLALTLHAGSYDWRFHAAGSDFSDSGTASCH